MALFTVVTGNGFAAFPVFPVIAGGIGIPVLVGVYHATPAVMAANFNIVPAALLEPPDRNAVIKAQLPTALPLLGANIVLLYFLMYR